MPLQTLRSRISEMREILTQVEHGAPSDGLQTWSACIFYFILPVLTRLGLQNEYAREIREYRAQEKLGKAHGKIFVKG